MTVGLEHGLKHLGHRVEEYRAGNRYDLILIFNQSAHVTDYVYPAFPEKGEKFAFVDTAEYGYFKRLPEIVGDYAHAFRKGSMSHDTKNVHEQNRMREFLSGKSFPYFLREFSKHVAYGSTFHPIDYPMYHGSECHVPPRREEYVNRDLDLFCSWGLSHPWRADLTQALRGCHVKSEIFVLEENGTPRMDQRRYFNRTRAAKVSVSYDGYGSSSFRLTEVLCRTVLLLGPLSIVMREPLTPGKNCVSYEIESEGEKFISTNLCEVMRSVLGSPETAFDIYASGFEHCFTHLTEKATAQYVLDKIEAHDSSVVTPIE